LGTHRLGSVLADFDWTSGYGVAVAVASGILLWAAVVSTGHGFVRAIRARFFSDPPPSMPPAVVLGGPACDYMAWPVQVRQLERDDFLVSLKVGFLIENKEALVTVRNLEAGVRRTDGREQRFEAFKAPALAPLSNAPVTNFVVDNALIDGLGERDFRAAFVWWARFTGPDGIRWEIGFDGATNDYLEPRVIADD
jgi:hypothetical protein